MSIIEKTTQSVASIDTVRLITDVRYRVVPMKGMGSSFGNGKWRKLYIRTDQSRTMSYGPASKYYDYFASMDGVDFYTQLAMDTGGKALELGVGTGRVAIELAKAGAKVLGIDDSRYMLAVARDKLGREEPEVRKRLSLVLADMRRFHLQDAFPLVYIPSASFEHLTSTEDQRRCLRCIREALEEEGILAMDLSQIPTNRRSSRSIDRRRIDADEEVVRTVVTKPGSGMGLLSVELSFEFRRLGLLVERHCEMGVVRLFRRREVVGLLEQASFGVETVFSDFDRSPYRVKRKRMVIVARSR